MNLSHVMPFEICSIRPPTENYSLTFRLTRNCGWNRCMFCPVYKTGALFSRRSIEEVKRDINNAKQIDDILVDAGLFNNSFSAKSFLDIDKIILEIRKANPDCDSIPLSPAKGKGAPTATTHEDEDERMAWFSSWFRETPAIEESVYHVATWRRYGGRSCFLGDANSLILSADFFSEAVDYMRDRFPALSRFTIYGRTKSAAKKKLDEMKAFSRAGLDRIHFGIESGSDGVLSFMRKGETARDHIEGCRKTREAGISPSVYVMPGLGGAKWSIEHAIETARVLTEAKPDYIRLRTLEIFPGTGLLQAMKAGEFKEATEDQIVREIRVIVEQTDCETEIVSDSASNLLDISGRLPHDRARMLSVIDGYLGLSEREKIVFSLSSRLNSFVGQYGGISDDIGEAIRPYVRDGAIDPSGASDEELKWVIRLIRSKLMP